MTAEKTEDLLIRALALLCQIKPEEPPVIDWFNSRDALILEHHLDDRVVESMREDQEYINNKPRCSPHTYSRAMGQRYPRRCTKCGTIETKV